MQTIRFVVNLQESENLVKSKVAINIKPKDNVITPNNRNATITLPLGAMLVPVIMKRWPNKPNTIKDVK